MRRIFLILLCLILHQTSAQFPTVCVENITKPNSVCCPIPDGSRRRCGGPERGECVRIYSKREKSYFPMLIRDDRYRWPTRFFKYACECRDNFWGYDCSECWFGFKGRNCERRDLRVRRNIFTFDKEEKKLYQRITEIFHKRPSDFSILIEADGSRSDPIRKPIFREVSGHNYLVFIHQYAARDTLHPPGENCSSNDTDLDTNHSGPGFPTWHRYFTLLLERFLVKIASEFGWDDFALPYWDWVDATYCEVCFNDIVGFPGECNKNNDRRLHFESQFYNFDEWCSLIEDDVRKELKLSGDCYGCHINGNRTRKLVRDWHNLKFPTIHEVNYTLTRTLYFIPGEWDSEEEDKCSFNKALHGGCGLKKYFKNVYNTMHNSIHNSASGTFMATDTAPGDPIFFLHHSQLDRFIDKWFERFDPTVEAFPEDYDMPGHSRHSNMIGFFPSITHADVFVDIEDLGYTYDSDEFGDVVRKKLGDRIPKPYLEHFRVCKEGYIHTEFELHRHHIQGQPFMQKEISKIPEHM